MARLELLGLDGIGEIRPGDDLAGLFFDALRANNLELRDHDILVVAQKVVSKSENRFRDLTKVKVSDKAAKLATKVAKDERLVELILQESTEVVRYREGVLIVRHRCGVILANAGIDQSNVEQDSEQDAKVLLLPIDPDRSADQLRNAIQQQTGREIGVLINDSLGRPWRQGTVGTAIGCAGIPSLIDERGQHDRFRRELLVTEIGHADELAAAASIVQGQAAESRPMVLARGARRKGQPKPAAALQRPASQDLFR